MSDFLTTTTELDAINAILASVGESPVTEVDGEFVDASLALQMLTEEAVVSKRWAGISTRRSMSS